MITVEVPQAHDQASALRQFIRHAGGFRRVPSRPPASSHFTLHFGMPPKSGSEHPRSMTGATGGLPTFKSYRFDQWSGLAGRDDSSAGTRSQDTAGHARASLHSRQHHLLAGLLYRRLADYNTTAPVW